MTTYQFTAYAEADLFSGNIAEHLEFTLPERPTLSVSVKDDDDFLSGDADNNELGDDHSEQLASIMRDSAEIGNGDRLYIEQLWTLTGDDGNTYQLAELEQPGFLTDNFTFVGGVPAAGVKLTVGHSTNVSGHGIAYSGLGAGVIPQPNIVDIAAGSDDFNLLVKALGAAGLVEAVRNSDDITVFAPTDAAFAALAADLGYTGDATDEDGVFDFIVNALTDLSPDGNPIPLLTDILLYHVSPGSKTAAEVDAADQVETLLTGATFGSEGTELIDNEPDVDNPNIVAEDIGASNGTIQVLDKVLLPIDIPGNTPVPTLAGLVAASGGAFDDDNTDFDLLLNAIQAAGLEGALDDPDADLTVFAPTDAAFIGLAQALGFTGSDEGEAFSYIVDSLRLLSASHDPIPLLTDILTYHVAPGTLDSTAVLASTMIETLQGGELSVDGASLVDADPDITNPNLIGVDIAASNGIAHAIDGVLIPADILQSNGANDVDFIIAGNKRDNISVGSDNDFVDGNRAADRIFLGSGDDVGFGGHGNDLIKSGSGDDIAIGGSGRDTIFGDAGNDIIEGGSGDDEIFGGADDDQLFGNSGNDLIRGGGGDDLIRGGSGDDTLFGGSGQNTFVFKTTDGNDSIFGFTENDTIDLKGYGFSDFSDIEDQIETVGHESVVISLGENELFVSGKNLSLTSDDFLF